MCITSRPCESERSLRYTALQLHISKFFLKLTETSLWPLKASIHILELACLTLVNRLLHFLLEHILWAIKLQLFSLTLRLLLMAGICLKVRKGLKSFLEASCIFCASLEHISILKDSLIQRRANATPLSNNCNTKELFVRPDGVCLYVLHLLTSRKIGF